MSNYDSSSGDEQGTFSLEHYLNMGINSFSEAQAHIGVILAGKPGIGKSTLVNALFGEELAPTGTGRSVTTEVTRYNKPGYPISIYDTPGVAVGQSLADYTASLTGTVRENYIDPERRIHFGLYCVLGTGERFEQPEEHIVAAVAQEVPVALVLTQCPSLSDKRVLGLKADIAVRKLDVVSTQPFLTLAHDMEIGGTNFPAFGLLELVLELGEQLEDSERHTFVRYQNVSLELKISEAKKIINRASAVTATIAATPIPILDAIPISIAQLAMLGKISAQMGLDVDVKAIITALGTIFGVATVARFAASFFKLIPGLGSVINASIASTTTKSLGEAFLKACSQVIRRRIAGEDIADVDVTNAVIGELRNLFH